MKEKNHIWKILLIALGFITSVILLTKTIFAFTLPGGTGTVGGSEGTTTTEQTTTSYIPCLEYIGEGAFMNTGITTANIGPRVSLYNYSFAYCKNLTQVNFSSGLNTKGNSFCIRYSLYENNKDCFVGNYAFYCDTNLVSVNDCDNLTQYPVVNGGQKGQAKSEFPVLYTKAYSSYGKYCFANCYKLETVPIYNYMKRIEDGTFYNCRKLNDIKTFSTDTKIYSIGDKSFYNCSDLSSLGFRTDFVKLVANSAFDNTSFSVSDFTASNNIIWRNNFNINEQALFLNYSDDALTGSSSPNYGYKNKLMKKLISNFEENEGWIFFDDSSFDGGKSWTYYTSLLSSSKQTLTSFMSDCLECYVKNYKSGNFKYVLVNSTKYISYLQYLPSSCSTIYFNCDVDYQTLNSISFPSTVTSLYVKAGSGLSGSKFGNANVYELEDNAIYYLNVVEAPSDSYDIFGSGNYFVGLRNNSSYYTDMLKNIVPDAHTCLMLPNCFTTIQSNVSADFLSIVHHIKVPSSFEEIGSSAFVDNDNLYSIDMSESSISTIGNNAFLNCHSLDKVVLSPLYKELINRVFVNCTIKDLVLPSGITYCSSNFTDSSTVENLYIFASDVDNINIECSNCYILGSSGDEKYNYAENVYYY